MAVPQDSIAAVGCTLGRRLSPSVTLTDGIWGQDRKRRGEMKECVAACTVFHEFHNNAGGSSEQSIRSAELADHWKVAHPALAWLAESLTRALPLLGQNERTGNKANISPPF